MMDLTHCGKLLHECTVPGESRLADRYPGHINGTQIGEHRFLLLYSTRGWRGSDDNMSVIFQIRDGAYDGELVREGRLALTIDDWQPLEDGRRYVRSHIHPLCLGVPKGAVVGGSVPAHAGLFAFMWHRYARYVDPETGFMGDGAAHYAPNQPFDASTVTEWKQVRVNDAQDDLVQVQPLQPLRQKGFAAGYAFCERQVRQVFPTFTLPVRLDDAGTEWLAPQSFYRDYEKYSAALRFTYNPLRGLFEWTRTGPLSAPGLFEPSALPYRDGWVISARMSKSWETRGAGGPIAWMRTDDPFAQWPEPTTPSSPVAGSPSTAYRCADGVVRVISNDRTVSPHPHPRNPLYVWDIDPDNGFQAGEPRVVFDSVEGGMPIRDQARPVVDQGKVFPHAGGPSQILAHRLRTYATFDPDMAGVAINEQERMASGIYYARMDYGDDCEPLWSFR